MLLITRRVGEKIMVGDDVVVHVMEIVGNTVRVGIQAPRSVPVYREEIWHAVREENRAAADAPVELPTPARSWCPASSRGVSTFGHVSSNSPENRPLGDSTGTVHCGTPSGGNVVSKLSKKARNALIARTALSLAREHLTPPKPKKRRGRKLLFGGLIAGAVAAVVLKRDKVLALLPGHSESENVPPPPPAPPAPSNYDVSGPVSNPAPPVPAPDPVEAPAIDEAAEEAAAAAEAANIGGPAPDYAAAAEPGQLAPEEDIPVAEAGEGESEGAEQAEALVEERGEEPAPEAAADLPPGTPAEPAAPGEKPVEEQPSEWRTWSGRSVNP